MKSEEKAVLYRSFSIKQAYCVTLAGIRVCFAQPLHAYIFHPVTKLGAYPVLDDHETIFPTYEGAVEEAERTRRSDISKGLVTKVQNSPYGSGFIVRSFPRSFLVRSRLRQEIRSVDLDSL